MKNYYRENYSKLKITLNLARDVIPQSVKLLNITVRLSRHSYTKTSVRTSIFSLLNTSNRTFSQIIAQPKIMNAFFVHYGSCFKLVESKFQLYFVAFHFCVSVVFASRK